MDDIRKIRRSIADLEAKVQALADSNNDMLSVGQAATSKVSEEYDVFVKEIHASMTGTIASSIDTAKAKLMEEFTAYVDAKIRDVVSQLDVVSVKVDEVSAKLDQKVSELDQKIADVFTTASAASAQVSELDSKVADVSAKVEQQQQQ